MKLDLINVSLRDLVSLVVLTHLFRKKTFTKFIVTCKLCWIISFVEKEEKEAREREEGNKQEPKKVFLIYTWCRQTIVTERFLTECSKTKNKVIPLTHQKLQTNH